jgi:hypothetical protein
MVPAQKQIWRSVEQNRGLGYEWQIEDTAMPTSFLTKAPKTYDGEKTASSTNVAGKRGYLPALDWNCIHAYHPVLVSTESALKS